MENKSLEWKEFRDRKNQFFSDQNVLTKLKLAAFSVELPAPISIAIKNLQTERTKKYKHVSSLIRNLQVELNILNEQMNGGTKRFSDCLADLQDALDFEMGFHEKAPEIKRGPKSYPEFLKKWIFETIEMAKDDRDKLMILVDFFYPRGEFDKWIQKQTNGLLEGPFAKYHADEKEVDRAAGKNWDRLFQWLRDQKAICKIVTN